MEIFQSISHGHLTPTLIAASLGVTSHLSYFIHGEHHMQVVTIAQIAFIAPIITALAVAFLLGETNLQAAKIALHIEGSFLVGLWTSMLVYRAFFHRLRSFPGPTSLKLSKFAHVFQLGSLDNYRKLDKWHEDYGDFVRTGPNELSIVDPEAVEATMGAKSPCTKSVWYDLNSPLVSLHQMRDRAVHDKRRRAWDQGFSIKALDSYQTRVKSFSDSLASKIKSFKGVPINATLWFNYYSFDVMGALAFGKSFDMLETGEKHFAIELLAIGQRPLGYLGPMPWLAILFSAIPGVSVGYHRWLDYCEKQAKDRQNRKVEERDIMSALLEAEPMSNDAFKNRMWLVGDARLTIVAGSDTTAATLAYMFYHFARDNTLVEKLRNELVGLQKEDGSYDVRELGNANVLNGIINETLRLHPAIPSGVLRQTPPGGIVVGGREIPGGVDVTVPLYTMHRSPKAFERPLEFIPERWYSKPELILNKTAFAPFSIGPYGCIGKNLALMEVRTVTADLITKFDVSFAPGEDGRKLLHETEDYFSLGLGELNLVFNEKGR